MSILQFFDFFFYLMSFSTVYTIKTHSFYFLFPSCICWRSKTKVSQLTFLFDVLYLSLLKSNSGTQISYVLQFFHEHRI